MTTDWMLYATNERTVIAESYGRWPIRVEGKTVKIRLIHWIMHIITSFHSKIAKRTYNECRSSRKAMLFIRMATTGSQTDRQKVREHLPYCIFNNMSKSSGEPRPF